MRRGQAFHAVSRRQLTVLAPPATLPASHAARRCTVHEDPGRRATHVSGLDALTKELKRLPLATRRYEEEHDGKCHAHGSTHSDGHDAV